MGRAEKTEEVRVVKEFLWPVCNLGSSERHRSLGREIRDTIIVRPRHIIPSQPPYVVAKLTNFVAISAKNAIVQDCT